MTEPFADGADYVEFKEIESENSLREFVAGVFGWSPVWMKALFGARYVLAKALRLDTASVPRSGRLRPEDVGFAPGDRVAFFTVRAGDPERYLIAGVDDSHLSGYLTVESVPRGFRLGTIVHFPHPRRPGHFAPPKP